MGEEKLPQLFNQELFDRYKLKMNELLLVENSAIYAEIESEIQKFVIKLKETYGDRRGRFALWHVLAASTIAPEMTVDGDDLSGPDSIAAFIDYLTEKYKDHLPRG